MSFLHLMQWHSEWVQKLNHWEKEEMEKYGHHHSTLPNKKNRRKRIPFIVVANKIDLLVENKSRRRVHKSSPSSATQRRPVMGFRNGEYGGRELRYEYAAGNATVTTTATATPQCENSLKHETNCDQPHCNTSTKRSNRRNNSSVQKQLTYSLKETTWYTDTTYLNALQQTEDTLLANRLLILIWCKRNNIPHVEASALDGRGVKEAMERLVEMGVDELRIREEEELERKNDDGERLVEECGRTSETLLGKGDNGEGIAHLESGFMESLDVGKPNTSVHNVDTNSNGILDRNDGTGPERNSTSDVATSSNIINAAAATNTSTTNTMDPSQYYFLYQPRQDEKLDLFARYSPKDEQHWCSPFKCWLSLFSYFHP